MKLALGYWLALGAMLPWANAETITGKVVGVAYGDTITVLDTDLHQHKVRLAGIDAPEKKQDFGQSSKQNLSAMAFGRSALQEYARLCTPRPSG